MKFIVLIFLHSVLFFYVVFMCNLSGVVRNEVQAVTVFACGLLGASLAASRSGSLCPGTVVPC